jgi:type IV secretory pathway VirB10-like protein
VTAPAVPSAPSPSASAPGAALAERPVSSQPRNPHDTARLLQDFQNNAAGPLHKLYEGTIIESVLTNRLNSSFTGPVDCLVTTTVWSQNREHILVPQGSRVLGEARRVTQIGENRLAVVFHRIVMPDGYSASLDKFTGLNQIGETGLKDKVDNHYVRIFGASLALGAIAGLATANSTYSAVPTGGQVYRQGFSQQLSQEGVQILDRFLNVLPTVTIREGARVKVYLTGDLLLPAYDNHRMPNDL